MIIVDTETTGLDPQSHQMLSLGAVDYETGEEFYGECRLLNTHSWTQKALNLNGFSYEQMIDIGKQTPQELLIKFIFWSEKREKLIAGHNIGSFDVQFMQAIKIGSTKIQWPFGYRFIDLHSTAYAILGKSLGLEELCDELGIEREVLPHNALNGAKKEAECFKKLLNPNFQSVTSLERGLNELKRLEE